MTRFLLIIFVTILTCTLGQTKLVKQPYIFDPGTEATLSNNSILLSKADMYSAEAGYGWVIAPNVIFKRGELLNKGLRNDLTIDGVSGERIKFKIDLPKGEWSFTFWMEAGLEDVNTAELIVSGTERKLNWHQFRPPSEPHTKIQDYYRVYNSKEIISDDGFSFSLLGREDSVRLLGISLIPVAEPAGEEQERILTVIKEAGRYKSKVSLSDLSIILNEKAISSPKNSFYVYWAERLKIFAEAERLNDLLGWEWFQQLTGWSIFSRMHQSVMLFDDVIEHKDYLTNLLLEKALWKRAKLCYDLNLERGGKYNLVVVDRDLKYLRNLYPEDVNIRMVQGEKIDFPDFCDNIVSSAKAPRWSVLQREVICRLSSEIDWWVNRKQAPNGEIGGKIGDDVEILRWWTSFILLGHDNAITGWKNIADAVWNDPKVYKGYSKKPIDVEHSSEFIADSTPELILVDDDSTYLKRLVYSADYFENLWTGVNENGRRFFKSAWYSSTEVDERPPRNRDLDYNARAVKAVRYLAWATRNQKYIKPLYEWSKSWLNASMRTDKGKPKGVMPASMRWYDDALNGDEPNWYEANMFWPYFDWERRPGTMILDQLLFTYTLTGDESLLKPITLSLEMVNDLYRADTTFYKKEYERGSKNWQQRFWQWTELFGVL